MVGEASQSLSAKGSIPLNRLSPLKLYAVISCSFLCDCFFPCAFCAYVRKNSTKIRAGISPTLMIFLIPCLLVSIMRAALGNLYISIYDPNMLVLSLPINIIIPCSSDHISNTAVIHCQYVWPPSVALINIFCKKGQASPSGNFCQSLPFPGFL